MTYLIWLAEQLNASTGLRLSLTGAIFCWLSAYPGFEGYRFQKVAIYVSAVLSVLGVLMLIWLA
jgi:hypothetical protein